MAGSLLRVMAPPASRALTLRTSPQSNHSQDFHWSYGMKYWRRAGRRLELAFSSACLLSPPPGVKRG